MFTNEEPNPRLKLHNSKQAAFFFLVVDLCKKIVGFPGNYAASEYYGLNRGRKLESYRRPS